MTGDVPERQRIEAQLARMPEVAFAVLFGSRAGGAARPDSDWDVGVGFREGTAPRERVRLRSLLVAALEPAVSVDVVVLDDAPALLARRALDGERLLVRDRAAWVRFVVRTLAAAGDEVYWRELHARERAKRLAEGRFGRP